MVPQAFTACCFMQNTLAGTAQGCRVQLQACLKAFWAGDYSKSSRMPKAGFGIISRAHSSVESISVKAQRSVLRPILVTKVLMTQGLDQRGIQFYSLASCMKEVKIFELRYQMRNIGVNWEKWK